MANIKPKREPNKGSFSKDNPPPAKGRPKGAKNKNTQLKTQLKRVLTGEHSELAQAALSKILEDETHPHFGMALQIVTTESNKISKRQIDKEHKLRVAKGKMSLAKDLMSMVKDGLPEDEAEKLFNEVNKL